MRLTIAITIIILAATGCKKDDCDNTYTISGRMLNGTTGEPYADTSFGIRAVEKKDFGGIDREVLGRSETDSEGNFSITYRCTSIGDEILLSMGNQEASLPKNQNLNDYIIYFSPEGSFDVYIKLKEPVEANDTFFMSSAASFELNDVKIDTFINPKEGFVKNIRTPNKSYTIFWGRSSNKGAGKFIFNPQDKTFGAGTPNMGINPLGDPYKDKLELEF